MLENIDLEKPDKIGFKEYLENLTFAFGINFGDFETNYPVPVFLDSVYISSKKGSQVSRYLNLFRKVLKAANDSIGLNRFKEVSNLNNAKVRFDYSRGSQFEVNYYSRDINGNWKTDSSVVYLSIAFDPSDDILRVFAEHEIGHTHVPSHSPYSEDVMSTSYFIPNKSYSKADKLIFRVLALAKPGTYWKKFVKR